MCISHTFILKETTVSGSVAERRRKFPGQILRSASHITGIYLTDKWIIKNQMESNWIKMNWFWAVWTEIQSDGSISANSRAECPLMDGLLEKKRVGAAFIMDSDGNKYCIEWLHNGSLVEMQFFLPPLLQRFLDWTGNENYKQRSDAASASKAQLCLSSEVLQPELKIILHHHHHHRPVVWLTVSTEIQFYVSSY